LSCMCNGCSAASHSWCPKVAARADSKRCSNAHAEFTAALQTLPLTVST
jgi:hypothetical protein